MNVRETLNKQGPLAKGAIIGVLVLLIAVTLWDSLKSAKPNSATQAYYTTDDGQTTFVDDFFRPYPFDHDGKPAFRAYMFQTGKGKQYVGYLERYTDEGLKELAPVLVQEATPDQRRDLIQPIHGRYTEVKKPNDPNAKWYRSGSGQGASIENAPSPDGPTDNYIMIFP